MILILLETCRASHSGAKHTHIVFSPSTLIDFGHINFIEFLHSLFDRVLAGLGIHNEHRIGVFGLLPGWPSGRGTWWWCSAQASFFWAFLRRFLYFLLSHGVLVHQKVCVLQIYLWLWTPLNTVFLAFKTFSWEGLGLPSLLLVSSW